jgi:hypothetical protein
VYKRIRTFPGAILLTLCSCVALAADALADTRLPPSVRQVLELRRIPDDSVSILVTELGSDKTIVSWHDEVPRNPASYWVRVTSGRPNSMRWARSRTGGWTAIF